MSFYKGTCKVGCKKIVVTRLWIFANPSQSNIVISWQKWQHFSSLMYNVHLNPCSSSWSPGQWGPWAGDLSPSQQGSCTSGWCPAKVRLLDMLTVSVVPDCWFYIYTCSWWVAVAATSSDCWTQLSCCLHSYTYIGLPHDSYAHNLYVCIAAIVCLNT